MCFKDFPRTRTLYIVTITFFKTTARKTCTNINTSYHISLEYELDDRGRQELFKNFDFHKKTNIKIQTNISYSTTEDNIENISLVIITITLATCYYTCEKKHKLSILIMALQGKYFNSNLLRNPCVLGYMAWIWNQSLLQRSQSKTINALNLQEGAYISESKGVVSKCLFKDINMILELQRYIFLKCLYTIAEYFISNLFPLILGNFTFEFKSLRI